MIILNNNINNLLNSLSKSKFRGSFHLNKKMKDYVKEKGLDKIKSDARDLITKRLAQENPINDGKQTPMKQVHPVFIAQHATGCCCRTCLEKIHNIKKGRKLTNEEINYIIDVLMQKAEWLCAMQMKQRQKKGCLAVFSRAGF